ncbi:hypothetical protein [Mycoplasma capricolum]|uniref:NAD(+) hydrolase ThsA Sir2/TIR-associating SLOG domain-containing protein n=1 Tax=Mycoplasma capricolum subsp. capricolum 14232 TaxID=1188238 RepID=A0A084EJ60_MYCCA|nr:hypothetical protein [Mycoplasma capricolum]KEZ18002.1 hypothetical protein MCAPa_7260 [Mycoplasma capricolum subsp. capricolum 14232]
MNQETYKKAVYNAYKTECLEKPIKRIFISGSADKYDGFKNENDAKLFLHTLAYKLAENNYHIVNGYGKGVGDFLLSGITEFCLKNNKKISDHLTIAPFPQNNISKANIEELYMKNREQMIEKCDVAIFVFGNKNSNNAKGVTEEYQLIKQKGLTLLPIKFTGGSAEQIFDLEYPNSTKTVKDAFDLINNSSTEHINKLVENILEAINLLQG